MISIYQMIHSGHGKQVIFTKYSIIISDSIDGSKISLGKVDHKNKLYVFSKFLLRNPTYTTSLPFIQGGIAPGGFNFDAKL